MLLVLFLGTGRIYKFSTTIHKLCELAAVIASIKKAKQSVKSNYVIAFEFRNNRASRWKEKIGYTRCARWS